MGFILDAERRPTLSGFDDEMEGYIDQSGDVLFAWMIQEGLKPVDMSHFPSGNFEQVVKVDGVAGVLNTQVAKDKRWSEQHSLPSGVTVLELQNPEIHQANHRLADLVKTIAAAEAYPHGQTDLVDALSQYGAIVDKAADATSERFKQEITRNTVCLTLLNGGQRSESRFVPPSIMMSGEDLGAAELEQRVRVVAKRLDVVDEEGNQNLLFGFREWNGLDILDAVQEQHGSIRLVIPDDCLATAGSTISAVEVLIGKGYQLDEVVFYGTVGSQQGIQLFMDRIFEMKSLKGLGIEPKVVVAGVVFGLNEHGYLIRLADEIRPDGQPYGKVAQAVGDMGVNQENLRRIEEARG